MLKVELLCLICRPTLVAGGHCKVIGEVSQIAKGTFRGTFALRPAAKNALSIKKWSIPFPIYIWVAVHHVYIFIQILSNTYKFQDSGAGTHDLLPLWGELLLDSRIAGWSKTPRIRQLNCCKRRNRKLQDTVDVTAWSVESWECEITFAEWVIELDSEGYIYNCKS